MERIEAMALVRDLAQKFLDTVPEPIPMGWGLAHSMVCSMIAEAWTADADPAAKAKLALEVAAPMNIEGTMVLSTAHIGEPTALALGNGETWGAIVYDHANYGFLLAIPEEGTFWAPKQAKVNAAEFPTDLFDVMDYARRHGCCWLLLDADAAQTPGLPTFDW